MQNHKGEIATLLTLGLVIVGTLITLGTSLLVNNKKNIASNPKAATYKLCCKTYACGAYGAGEGNMKVTAVGFEGINSSGTVGYTSCNNTGYLNTTYCSSISGAPQSNGGSTFVKCDGSGPVVGGPTGSETETPTGCENKSCSTLNFGNSDHDVSYYTDKPEKFYFEKDCGGDPVNRTVIQDDDHCLKAVKKDCTPSACGNFPDMLLIITPAYDKEFAKNHSVFTKTGDPKFYTGEPCDVLDEITFQEACIPPASQTHTCTIIVECKDILGNNYTGQLHQWSDEQGSENYYITDSCLSEAKPKDDCTNGTAPPPASNFSCAGMKSYTIPEGKTCTCYFDELNGGDELQTSFANFSNLCINTCYGNPFLGDTGYGGGDNGYCCPKNCGG